MRPYLLTFIAAALVTLLPVQPAFGQEESHLLAVGDEAPDFELAGATQYGILRDPVRLGDFRGKTVVLAFFYRVRTPG